MGCSVPDLRTCFEPGADAGRAEDVEAARPFACPVCSLRWKTPEMAAWCCDMRGELPREAYWWLKSLALAGITHKEALDCLGFFNSGPIGEMAKHVARKVLPRGRTQRDNFIRKARAKWETSTSA